MNTTLQCLRACGLLTAMATRHGAWAAAALLGCAAGCTPAGEGKLRVEVAGSALTTRTILAGETEDGWSIRFVHFYVVVNEVRVPANQLGVADGYDGVSRALDIASPAVQTLTHLQLTGGSYDMLEMTLAPAEGSTEGVNVPQDVLAEMAARGLSVLVDGRLFKDAISRSFRWGFAVTAQHTACPVTIRISSNQESSLRMIFNGDQMFRQGLDAASEFLLRADAQANADGNGDGTITEAELAAVSGTRFTALAYPDPAGRTDIQDLYRYEEQCVGLLLRSAAASACPSVALSGGTQTDGGIP